MSDEMLQEAIEALRRKDKARARDLLTRLLKDDQKNAETWVWMSATVDTAKERIYCLQTALQLDPQNAAAKRGLVLLGGLPPDPSTPPFPMKQVRVWEEEIMMAGEQPKEKGFKAFAKNPLARLVGLLVLGAAAVSALFFLAFAPRSASFLPTRTPGPSPTFSPTVTSLPTRTPIYRTPTPAFAGTAPPLSDLLKETYTPTPLYVQVTHGVASRAIYDIAMESFMRGDYDQALSYFQQVDDYEQGSADALYYIGEIHRFKSEYQEAFDAYTGAVAADPGFGPGYLGLARVQPFVNNRVDPISNLDKAVEYAPDFAEAYVARAEYYLDHDRPDDAVNDLESARDLAPESAPAHYNLARAYLDLGLDQQALEAAEEAYALDVTLLDNYLALGEAYAANDQVKDALEVMQTYVLYVQDNATAYTILGSAYIQNGEYEAALEALNRSLALDRSQGELYLQRGYAYLETDHGLLAENDFRAALTYFPRSFEAQIGIVRSLYIRELYGDMYNRVETARAYAETDAEMAQVLYWRAVSLDELNNPSVAYRDWQALLALPPAAVPAEWREYARERVEALRTPTPSPRASVTPTPSRT
ncbi:MAG: tetratricopeptide repeat protein, partial [Chloroflexota bacterium]